MIPNDLADFIKEESLKDLNSKTEELMNASAQVVSSHQIVAQLYVLELRKNNWANMLSGLISILTEKQLEFKVPSLLTLSYICDHLQQESFDMPETQAQNILKGLFFCLEAGQPDEGLRLTAIRALQTSLRYYQKILEDKDTMTFFMDLLVVNITFSIKEISRKAFEVLVESVKPLYLKLEDYLAVITQLVVEIIKDVNRHEHLAIIATEFWAVVAQTELERRNSRVTLADPGHGRPQQDLQRVHLEVLQRLPPPDDAQPQPRAGRRVWRRQHDLLGHDKRADPDQRSPRRRVHRDQHRLHRQ